MVLDALRGRGPPVVPRSLRVARDTPVHAVRYGRRSLLQQEFETRAVQHVDPSDTMPFDTKHHRRQANSAPSLMNDSLAAIMSQREPGAISSGSSKPIPSRRALDAEHPASCLLSNQGKVGGRDALDDWIMRRHSNQYCGSKAGQRPLAPPNGMQWRSGPPAEGSVHPEVGAPSSRVLALAAHKRPAAEAARVSNVWTYGALGGRSCGV